MAIVLNTKSYGFAGIAQSVSTYLEKSLGLVSLFSRLTASVRLAEKEVRTDWRLDLTFPVDPETPCTCPNDTLSAFVKITAVMSNDLTAAQRADFALRIKDLAASTEYQSSLTGPTQPTT